MCALTGLSRRAQTGYAARTGQWELAGEGQPETVVQKYQRLQLELQQLDQEIAGTRTDGSSVSRPVPVDIVDSWRVT